MYHTPQQHSFIVYLFTRQRNQNLQSFIIGFIITFMIEQLFGNKYSNNTN